MRYPSRLPASISKNRVKIHDFRSDTVTVPTLDMLDHIGQSLQEYGDDVYEVSFVFFSKFYMIFLIFDYIMAQKGRYSY